MSFFSDEPTIESAAPAPAPVEETTTEESLPSIVEVSPAPIVCPASCLTAQATGGKAILRRRSRKTSSLKKGKKSSLRKVRKSKALKKKSSSKKSMAKSPKKARKIKSKTKSKSKPRRKISKKAKKSKARK